MILTEQTIKRLGRKYWGGSKFKYWDKNNSPFNCLYISNNIFYALTFLKNEFGDFRESGYIIEYWLKEKLNIFNARSKKDYQKLEDYCRKNDNPFLNILPKLKDLDWLDVFKTIEKRNEFIDILKNLQYDGFFNIENNQGNILRKLPNLNTEELYGFSGIGIFKEDSLLKYEIYSGWDSIKNITELQPFLKSAKIECIKDALKFYEKLPQQFKIIVNRKGPNSLKQKLSQKIIEESYLPYYLMLDKEIKLFINTLDFEKELKNIKNIEEQLNRNLKTIRNKYSYLKLII